MSSVVSRRRWISSVILIIASLSFSSCSTFSRHAVSSSIGVRGPRRREHLCEVVNQRHPAPAQPRVAAQAVLLEVRVVDDDLHLAQILQRLERGGADGVVDLGSLVAIRVVRETGQRDRHAADRDDVGAKLRPEPLAVELHRWFLGVASAIRDYRHGPGILPVDSERKVVLAGHAKRAKPASARSRSRPARAKRRISSVAPPPP